jgi:hypothetical protein|tara:strand:+ start:3336 stop:3509 length:174 start_codon:yes stop_codon:yes gene_type:complete
MKLFEFLKKYIVFGLGMIIGSAIGTVITYVFLSACYGLPEVADVLEIRECLEERINE